MDLQQCDHVTSPANQAAHPINPPPTPSPGAPPTSPPQEKEEECEKRRERTMVKVSPTDRTAQPTRPSRNRQVKGEIDDS